jgi:S1-C subfamily serine protease
MDPMLIQFSNQIADVVEGVAASVVQVQGSGQPASGLVYGTDVVLTTARAVGREEHPRVRRSNGDVLDAELVGVDPTTRVAVLKAPGLSGSALAPGTLPRVGHLAIAVARSWSNVVTATAGLVSVIGGPLPTGRRRAIERVIRTSAPMHEGFAGGAFVGANGELLGVTTAASIRGLSVVIPASIAWAAAADLLRRGGLKRGYLGIAVQPVGLPANQRSAAGAEEALLIVGVKEGTPAADAGLLIGDVLLSLDGDALTSPDDLYDLLVGDRLGRPVSLRVLRGGAPTDLTVTIRHR